MPKVLVVDDESDFRMVLVHILGRAGYQVVEAKDGVEGFDLAHRERPDLVIVDWNMPRMTGIEMCQALRRDPDFEKIAIIMLTVRQLDTDHAEGVHRGADLYLTKPIEPVELLNRIKALLRHL
ncbi:MAG: response regulator [Elusimicrobia bacterium]|nr:response regulator [Elusimicrobiota bacterium]